MQDGYWQQHGYPWEIGGGGGDGVVVEDPIPEAEGQDAVWEWEYCYPHKFRSVSPKNLTPDNPDACFYGSCGD
jgi:hypothetical protein